MTAVATPVEARGPLAVFGCAWRYRQLVARLTEREIESRFRGSLLGKLWAALIPLFMLAMYTFVFGVVLHVRWPGGDKSALDVALLYFVGLIVFNFFFDCVNRGPTLMLEHVSYIKKVLFPLEILSWVVLGGALFRLAVSAAVLLAFYLAIDGVPPAAILAVPLLLVPLALVALGCVWFLSALGVYLRDMSQLLTMISPATMFLSPVFYPLTNVPKPFQYILYANPLTFIIEAVRGAVFDGIWPNWGGFALYAAVAWLFAWAAHAWFMKMRQGFADVV